MAFEIAQQLCARGEEVALLALLDTASPLYRGVSTVCADPAEVLAFQGEIMARAGGTEIGIDPGELGRLDRAAQVDAVVERLVCAIDVASSVGEEQLRRVLTLYESHARCLAGYEPRPYPRRITMLRAREEQPSLAAIFRHPAEHEPDYGWSELCLEPVEVRWAPGNHSTMTYEPCVAGLAAELDAALAAAEAAAEAPVPESAPRTVESGGRR